MFKYNCKHFIVSNNTFRQWAVYLDENQNGIGRLAKQKLVMQDIKRRNLFFNHPTLKVMKLKLMV